MLQPQPWLGVLGTASQKARRAVFSPGSPVQLATRARLWVGTPAGYFVAMLCFVGVCLPLDHYMDVWGQIGLAGVTCLVLVASCRNLDGADRARVCAVVVVATCGEILGSILLGLYTYRLHNLPPFVPPGHGIIYLTGLRLSRSSLAVRHEGVVATAAVAVGMAWALAGLTLARRPDEAGALCMLCLICLVLRGRARALYCCMFLTVGLLEFYGTGIGVWRWEAVWPAFDISGANPPSGVAAGYCAFDAAALRLGPCLLGIWRHRPWLKARKWWGEAVGRLRRRQPSTPLASEHGGQAAPLSVNAPR